jgi:hypothetical protein
MGANLSRIFALSREALKESVTTTHLTTTAWTPIRALRGCVQDYSSRFRTLSRPCKRRIA